MIFGKNQILQSYPKKYHGPSLANFCEIFDDSRER